METIFESEWSSIVDSYQIAYENRAGCGDGSDFDVQISIAILAFMTLQSWAERIVDELGIDRQRLWSDAQFHCWFISAPDFDGELFELAIDCRDPSRIGLGWCAVEEHESELRPLRNYSQALEAAREFVVT